VRHYAWQAHEPLVLRFNSNGWLRPVPLWCQGGRWMLPDIASCRAFAFDVYSLFIGCEAFNGNQLNKVVLAVVVFGFLRVAGQARLHWHHD